MFYAFETFYQLASKAGFLYGELIVQIVVHSRVRLMLWVLIENFIFKYNSINMIRFKIQ